MGYQSGTRLQNYFDIARTSLGYSEYLNFNFQLVLFAQEYDDVPQTITFRRKKRALPFKVRTIHSPKQAHLFGIIIETIWIDFDWQHMFERVTKRLNCLDSPIKKSTEAIFSATVSKYA